MKFKKMIVALCAAALSLTVMSVTAFAADAGVAINEKNFPDTNFREVVKEFDTDDNNNLSTEEITAVKKMYCGSNKIASLDGIEFFTALEELHCYGNDLIDIDLSSNTELKLLECDCNKFTSLDLNKNTKLKSLICYSNPLTELDISGCTELSTLVCRNTSLTEIDVSKNSSLGYLECSECDNLEKIVFNKNMKHLSCAYCKKLTKLDLSGCTALEVLHCYGGNIAKLDISNSPNLITAYTKGEKTEERSGDDGSIRLWYNYHVHDDPSYDHTYAIYVDPATKILTEPEADGVAIDETNFPDETFREYVKRFDTDENGSFSADEIAAVTKIDCGSYNISSLKGLENFTALEHLDCQWNDLTTLDVSKNVALTYLDCYKNNISSLDVKKNTALTYLGCGYNNLTSLDVSKNTAITYLSCRYNNLTTLDVTKNTALDYLFCHHNKLSKLDVSKNIALTQIDCGSNQLTSLDVNKNTALIYLSCDDNKLTSIDISKNTKLESALCHNNKITEIDISNNPHIITAYTKGEITDPTYMNMAVGACLRGYHGTKPGESDKYYFITWDKATKIITASKSHTHTWDSGKVTKAATYGAKGVKTYTCTVCGATKTSSIAKKTVKKLTAKTTYTCTTNAIRINWNKLSGVTGYKIFRYDDAKKKWVAVKAIYNPNTTNYKISGLKSGKVYKFRVKAFVKENGKFYFGESCSTISTATRPNTTTVTKANKTSTAVRLFWKKTTCTGYRILRYDSAKKKWVRVTAVGSSSTTQYKISGLKKNTTYKFKVQPYVKVGSKVIDGAASAVFTVKTSK